METPPSDKEAPRKRVRPKGYQSEKARISRMAQAGLTIGKLASGQDWITRTLKALRDRWEAELVELHKRPPNSGELRALHVAVHWTQHAMVCQRGLRCLTLDPAVMLAFSKAIPMSLAQRDAVLARLGLQDVAAPGGDPGEDELDRLLRDFNPNPPTATPEAEVDDVTMDAPNE